MNQGGWQLRDGEVPGRRWAEAVVAELERLRHFAATGALRVAQGASGVRIDALARPEMELFELTGSLAAGSHAPAQMKTHDGTSWVNAAGPTREVYDSIGDKNATSGAWCWCYFSPRSGRWEIVQLECA